MMKSDCCGVEVVMDIADLELCPRCWEHCDVVIEDEDCEPDYIPGYDDGEWGEAEEEG